MDVAIKPFNARMSRLLIPTVRRIYADGDTVILFLRRPGSQAQYSILLAQQATMSDARMRDLPAHAESHLTHKLDVNTLAAFVAMSPRAFARQFEGNFGATPPWVRSLRVEAARQHLESRNLSLKEIARVTGFRDEQALRRAFVQQTQMTPREYRDRFWCQRINMSARGFANEKRARASQRRHP